MSDRFIRQDVMDELEFEPSVNATHIGVAVENGVVTLSGHVGSYFEKLAAEKAVRRVKGVRAIAQEIEIRHAFDKKTADDEIANRALKILHWGTMVPDDKIQVEVSDGWVTLSGEVDWQYQKAAAEDSVRLLSGISGVFNNITIRPHLQPADVKRKIEGALKRSAELDAQSIRVNVSDDGKISLHGTVHDWHARDTARKAAWSAPGVIAVDDQLAIA